MELKLPRGALVNKFIAKNKFYKRASLSSKLQNEFIDKIQKITWKYKLSEDTIGVTKTDSVTEIQIFEIELKEQSIPQNILTAIDNTIPYQILYKFVYNDNTAYGITLKEDGAKKSYYFSEWNTEIRFDFIGINLEKVYQNLIKAFITNEAIKKSDFKAVIDTDNKIKKLEKEIEILYIKMDRENQFNRKVEFNKSLLEKKKQLNILKENIT
jgi:hypothetical protein